MPGIQGKRLIVILALALSACQPPSLNLPPDSEAPVVLELAATDTAAPLLQTLGNAYQFTRQDTRIILRRHISSYGPLMNALQSPQDSPTPYALVAAIPAESPLWAMPVAQEPLVILTSGDNPTPGLESDQLRAIFTGQIINWAEVGGPDQPITVISREAESDVRGAFEALVMVGRPTTRHARLAPNASAMLQIVGETAGAIGYAPLSQVGPELRILAINGVLPALQSAPGYPYLMTFYLAGRAAPQGDYRDFFAWVQSPAGQDAAKPDYIPLPE